MIGPDRAANCRCATRPVCEIAPAATTYRIGDVLQLPFPRGGFARIVLVLRSNVSLWCAPCPTISGPETRDRFEISYEAAADLVLIRPDMRRRVA